MRYHSNMGLNIDDEIIQFLYLVLIFKDMIKEISKTHGRAHQYQKRHLAEACKDCIVFMICFQPCSTKSTFCKFFFSSRLS